MEDIIDSLQLFLVSVSPLSTLLAPLLLTAFLTVAIRVNLATIPALLL
jgi:hypothetical protein